MGPDRPGRTIVITGDTEPCEETEIAAEGAELLVHDSSFAADEAERAAETGHSTALGAAELAAAAGVGMLALVHISSRHFVPDILAEARTAFAATVAPRDFDLVEIPLPERGGPELIPNGARRGRREPAPTSSRTAIELGGHAPTAPARRPRRRRAGGAPRRRRGGPRAAAAATAIPYRGLTDQDREIKLIVDDRRPRQAGRLLGGHRVQRPASSRSPATSPSGRRSTARAPDEVPRRGRPRSTATGPTAAATSATSRASARASARSPASSASRSSSARTAASTRPAPPKTSHTARNSTTARG